MHGIADNTWWYENPSQACAGVPPPGPIGDEGPLHANRFHLPPTALQPICNRPTSSPTASTTARRRLCRRACDPLSDSPFLKHRPEPSPPCPPPSLTPPRPPPQDPLKPAFQRTRGRGATGGSIRFPDGSRLVTLRSNKVFRSASALDRFLTPRRGLRVWLPPCYDASPSKRYPVLYVHDGQNMMADHESWSGRSWGLDQALKRLIAQGSIESPIVVLIDNVAEEFGPFGLVRRRHPPLLPLSRGGPFESPPFFCFLLQPNAIVQQQLFQKNFFLLEGFVGNAPKKYVPGRNEEPPQQ